MLIFLFGSLLHVFHHEIIVVDNATVEEVHQGNVGLIVVASGLIIYLLTLVFVISIYCHSKNKDKHQEQMDELLRTDS